MKIVRVSDYDEFKGYKEEWDTLLLKSRADNIFLTYEWIDAYIRHFLKKRDLFILKVLDDQRLIGIAPLMIRRCRYFGLPVRVVSFIGTVISDRMNFITDADKKKAIGLILDYLMTVQREWDFIDLQEIADDTGTEDVIKEWLKDRKCINILGPSSRCLFIDFNREDGLSPCQRFSKSFQEKYRRANNKRPFLNLEFKGYRDNGSGSERLFADTCMIERHSWKVRKRKGIFSKADSRDFHREIFDRFLKNRWIYLSILKSDGRPIAYRYGYLYNRRVYSYNHSFDERYSNVSPGRMLVLWTLKGCVKEGISEYDFLRGEERWKGMLTKDFRTHNRIRIFRTTFYSKCLYYLQSRLMPYLKNKKTLHNAWMRIKENLGWA